jgi:D-alanine transaminase
MKGIRLAYLNGQYLAPDAAHVSVFDRGFVFGDGVYEVIPVFGGRLFRIGQHLARLDASCAAIRLRNPHDAGGWQTICARLAESLGPIDQSIYLQITRGVAPRDHAFPPDATPTVFAYAQEISYPSPKLVADGVAAVTCSDIRWQRCDIKAIALLANALLRQEAIDQGAAEAILLRDGCVTEGAASNIFIVKEGLIITPPKGPYILPGVTRDLVLELARSHGVPCAEATIHESDLYGADEVWLTSSTREILPVTRLNGKLVGDGRPGPVHARMFALYREYKQAFCEGRVE